MSHVMAVGSRAALVGSGVVAAATPAVVQASGARVLSLSEQGHLALALTVGAFAAQLLIAAKIEAPLSGAPQTQKLALPREVAALGIGGAVLFGAAPGGALSTWIGLPLMLVALLWGRTTCILHGDVKREVQASTLQGAALGGALFAAILAPTWAFLAVTLSGVLGIALRASWSVGWRSLAAPTRSRQAWIVGETAVTGLLQPLVNALLLAALGPAGSIGYRIVATVSGGLEPIISFARTRLLVKPARVDLIFSAAACVAATGVAISAGTFGLLELLFGAGWSDSLVLPLTIACLWRTVTLLTTMPFTALRRSGRAGTVFWLRLGSTSVYLALGVTAALLQSVPLVFLAFALAEVVTLGVYTTAALRLHSAGPVSPPRLPPHHGRPTPSPVAPPRLASFTSVPRRSRN